MDSGRFYALLRFEEASLALRAVLRMNLVDRLSDKTFSLEELRQLFGFTEQAARTFFPLLHVMGILEVAEDAYRVTELAATCLADRRATSRKPYLAIGTGAEVDSFIQLLQGEHAADALPLYRGADAGETVMDLPEVAEEIAFGLASRARNFATPLAQAIAAQKIKARTIADLGAGSPYVAQACLEAMPNLERVTLVDRPNAMRFALELAEREGFDCDRLEFREGDFFQAVPVADVYVVSNTAHDWRRAEYTTIANHIADVIPADGLVCIHEPLLTTAWQSQDSWVHALWMACYAQTLFRITRGEGTCYSLEEHHEIMANSGFHPVGSPVATSDGCTALFFRKTG